MGWGLDSFPKQQMIGLEEMASNCARGDLGWILGQVSSLKSLWDIGTGCPELSRHPWRYSKDVSMWCLRTWFSDWLGSDRLTVGLDDHGGLFKPKWFCDSMNYKLFIASGFVNSKSSPGWRKNIAFLLATFLFILSLFSLYYPYFSIYFILIH